MAARSSAARASAACSWVAVAHACSFAASACCTEIEQNLIWRTSNILNCVHGFARPSQFQQIQCRINSQRYLLSHFQTTCSEMHTSQPVRRSGCRRRTFRWLCNLLSKTDMGRALLGGSAPGLQVGADLLGIQMGRSKVGLSFACGVTTGLQLGMRPATD